MLARSAAFAAAFTLVACGHHVPRPTATPIAVAPATAAKIEVDPPRVAAIAIGAKDSVDLTADGTMLDVAKDMRIAIGQRVFTVKKESADGNYACHFDLGAGPYDYDGEYHGEGLSLVDPSGKSTVLVEKAEKETTENSIAIDKQEVVLTAVVGPYLFLHENHLFFGCGGAHPIRGSVGFIWDAKNEARVKLTPPASAFESVREQLKDKGMRDEEPRFVEVIPSFDAEGRFSIGWRFEKPAAYFDSQGGGSDYNISVVVEAGELPAELAAYREPPQSIRNYLANGGEPIVGYSTVN